MEILGKGLGGIVIGDSPGSVQKFYIAERSGCAEQAHLAFLGKQQEQGLNIRCMIPKLLEVVGKGEWEVEGQTYTYCNRMERVPGTSARRIMSSFNEPAHERLGRALGGTAFAMHSLCRAYTRQWKDARGGQDVLLSHIMEDKVGLVLAEEADKDVVRRVTDAANYLKNNCRISASNKTLSHLDFSLANTQADDEGQFYGLVDWGDFGLTDPSLSLYQFAYRSVWPYLENQYEKLGGTLRKDIIYAAAAIHLAFGPIICAQHNFPLDADETPERFETMYAKFQKYRQG